MLAHMRHLEYYTDIFNSYLSEGSRVVFVRDLRKYKAARTVQRCFRGHLTRKYLAVKQKAATLIQAVWRSYTVRKNLAKQLKVEYDEMLRESYKRSAIKIQTIWRGYWARKHFFKPKKLEDIVQESVAAGERLMAVIAEWREREAAILVEKNDVETREWILYVLWKLHHLIRTKNIPGVFSLPSGTDYSNLEFLLASVTFKSFMTNLKKARKRKEEWINRLKAYPNLDQVLDSLPDEYLKYMKKSRKKEDCPINKPE